MLEEVPCGRCGLPFLAPPPDTICDLPDGNCVSYCEPVIFCPLCDDNQFGFSWNEDFLKRHNRM